MEPLTDSSLFFSVTFAPLQSRRPEVVGDRGMLLCVDEGQGEESTESLGTDF